MIRTTALLSLLICLSLTANCQKKAAKKQQEDATEKSLPAPFATESVTNYSNVIGWKEGETPKAPEGFRVVQFAGGFDNPRWLYELPNGDVLVAESNSNYSTAKQVGAAIIGATKSNNVTKSMDRITILRDSDHDGKPELQQAFLTKEQGLDQPLGMLLLGNWLYVANTDAVLRFPYQKGQTEIKTTGEKIVDLPRGKTNRHWTRNLIANAAGTKIYIAVGSASNIAENGLDDELLRACILEMDPDGKNFRVFASGIRNPVGMAWAPGTQTLWTAVNERDELGNDLVPDYLTSVRENGFYGWPYSYWGNHADPRVKDAKPLQLKEVLLPEVDLGSHTASLGLAFCTSTKFPARYRNGAFIAQHGSWNRKPLSGYKVVFVPFKDGKPSGPMEDFLTGFIVDPEKDEVRGRPVCIIETQDGGLMLTDDKTNRIWKITAI